MLSPFDQYKERQFRYTRVCLSFLAMSSSVFLLPFLVRLFFREDFGSDSFFGYLPIFSGIYVAIVWLVTVVWPLLILPSSSWLYRSANALLAGIIHANLVTIPFLVPNVLDDEIRSMILICNLAGATSGLVFWSSHNWYRLTETMESSGLRRSLVFLWPIALAAVYYGLFPTILPEKAYPYMTHEIRKNIFVKDLEEMKPGNALTTLYSKYPYTYLHDHSSTATGLRESWIQDGDKIYRLETHNDTILRLWIEEVSH